MENEEVFTFKDGFLFCENLRIKDIQTQLMKRDVFPPSPCFVYSKRQLLWNIRGYQVALDKLNLPAVISYSMKANAAPALLSIIQAQGCSVTLVSGMELQMAIAAGFEPHLMILNGNGKQDWERRMAIEAGCLINADSQFDLKQTLTVCQNLNKKAKILLRINPDIDPQVHPYISTGLEASKFGISTENLEECIHLLHTGSAYLDLVGLHSHLGSTINNTDIFRSCTIKLLELTNKLKHNGFSNVKYINIGGGLNIDYKKLAGRTCPAQTEDAHSDSVATTDHQAEQGRLSRPKMPFKPGAESKDLTQTKRVPTAADLVASVETVLKDSNVTLIVEPGRSIIGNTAILAATVLGTKHNKNKSFIVTDAAMTEVLRPSLYSAYHHIELTEPSQEEQRDRLTPEGLGVVTDESRGEGLVKSEKEEETHEQMKKRHVFDIVGPVCESADFLGKDRLLPEPHAGCGIAVFDTGAYCSSMSSNYNMRLRPCEVLVDGDSWRLIRKPDTFEDLLRPYQEL